MSARPRTDRVRALLLEGRTAEVERLARDGAPVLRPLRSLLYSGDDRLRERAAEAVGLVAPTLRPDRLRTLLSALVWSLNDESGMSGRGSPEAIGRVIERLPALAPEYVPILLSYLEREEVALNDPLLDGGLLAALGRLGPDLVSPGEAGVARLRAMLRAPGSRLRGTAAWLAGRLGLRDLREDVERLAGDDETFPLYRDGELERLTIARAAREALPALA